MVKDAKFKNPILRGTTNYFTAIMQLLLMAGEHGMASTGMKFMLSVMKTETGSKVTSGSTVIHKPFADVKGMSQCCVVLVLLV
jgi:hypothetical protein